jgi:hemolysin activation/secretion protein
MALALFAAGALYLSQQFDLGGAAFGRGYSVAATSVRDFDGAAGQD